MRRSCAIMVLAVLVSCPTLFAAEEQLTSDQLRRMYDAAVAQMRTAQDRRNELARENEKLQTRIAELEKKLADAQTELTSTADNTYQARVQGAAFSELMEANPSIKESWTAFLRRNLFWVPDPKQYVDADWPFSCKR